MNSTEAIVGIIAAIVGIIGLPIGIWFQFFRKSENQDASVMQPGMSADERERLVRVESQLAELQEKTAAPPEGGAPSETDALAAQASDETERLLAEAIELQGKNKERDAIERLLTAYNMEMPAEAKAQLHGLAGISFFNLSELKEAEGHFRQALAATKEAEHRQGEATALGNLGMIYQQRGDLAKAQEHHQQALAIKREIGDRAGQADVLSNLGLIFQRLGIFPEAEGHFQQALVIDREIGNSLGEGKTLGNLGNTYMRQGDLAKAEDHLQQALAITRDTGDRLGEALTLGNLGNVHPNDAAIARDYYTQALAIQREIGDRLGEANQLGNLGLLAARTGGSDEACGRLKEALFIYDEIGAGTEGVETVRAKLEKLGCE